MRSLKSRVARHALLHELEQHSKQNRAMLEPQQFGMVVRLINAALQVYSLLRFDVPWRLRFAWCGRNSEVVYGSPCGRPEQVCLFILPWLALRRTGLVLKRTYYSFLSSSKKNLDSTFRTGWLSRGALHIRVISSTSAQRRIIRPHHTHRATPDDGQSTSPKRRVQVVFRATQERIKKEIKNNYLGLLPFGLHPLRLISYSWSIHYPNSKPLPNPGWVGNFPSINTLKLLYSYSNWQQILFKVERAWRETTPVCSELTRLVRRGYSRHNSGASRERARITRRAQDGSVHMQLVSRPAPIPPGRL